MLIPQLTETATWLTKVARNVETATKAWGDYDKQTRSIIGGNIDAADSVEDLVEAGKDLTKTYTDIGASGRLLTGTNEAFEAGIQDILKAIAAQSSSMEEYEAAVKDVIGESNLLIGSYGVLDGEVTTFTKTLYEQVQAQKTAEIASGRQSEALEDLARMGREAAQEQRNLEAATIDSSTATVQYSSYLERLNQAGREMLNQQRDKQMEAEAEAAELAAEAAELYAENLEILKQKAAGYFTAALPAIENTESLEYQLYKAAEAAKFSAGELAELGVGLGLFTPQAAEAALQTSLIRLKMDELATSYLAGEISQRGMREELQNFIAVLNGEYTAAVGGATETAGLLTDEIGEQKGLIGGTIEEIDRYNKILTGEAAAAASEAVTNYGNISDSVLDIKLKVDDLIESSEAYAGDSPYEAVYDSNAIEAGNEIDILKGKADSTAGTYNIHYTVTSDPFPQPEGGGATGGGAGNLPAPDANVGPGFQHGAHFIVPPQFTNDSFHFRANAGEEVIVRTPAQQQAAGGGVVIENITIVAQPGMDTQQVAEFVIREMGAEVRSRLNGRSLGGRF